MCKPLPYPRCSSHARASLDAALKSGDAKRIQRARTNFYTTPAGINALKEAGKPELAERYLERRTRLVEQFKRQERIRNGVTIGLDLDNTTGDFTLQLQKDVAKALGIPESEWKDKFPDPRFYSYAKSGWFADEDAFKLSFHAAEKTGLYKRMPVYRGANSAIRRLQAAGFKVKLITARGEEMDADTRAWLKRNRIPFNSLVFSKNKKEHPAHVYVDDSPDNINDLRANGKEVITYHQLYNKDISGSRVRDWSQLEKKLMAKRFKAEGAATTLNVAQPPKKV